MYLPPREAAWRAYVREIPAAMAWLATSAAVAFICIALAI